MAKRQLSTDQRLIEQHERVRSLQAQQAAAKAFLESFDETKAKLEKEAETQYAATRAERLGQRGRPPKSEAEQRLDDLDKERREALRIVDWSDSAIARVKSRLASDLKKIRAVESIPVEIDDLLLEAKTIALRLSKIHEEISERRQKLQETQTGVAESWSVSFQTLAGEENLITIQPMLAGFVEAVASGEKKRAMEERISTGELNSDDEIEMMNREQREYQQKLKDAANSFRNTSEGRRLWKGMKNCCDQMKLNEDKDFGRRQLQHVQNQFYDAACNNAGLEKNYKFYPRV